jgi:GNAT superfamily N-acetyltransferase
VTDQRGVLPWRNLPQKQGYRRGDSWRQKTLLSSTKRKEKLVRNMEFIELKTHEEWEESFELFQELVPQLDKEVFLKALNDEILKEHKLFGLRVCEKLVSVAAVWILMTGLSEKIMWIYGFVTTKEMRSRGFGKQLVLELENYAKKENFNELRVHTSRKDALKFWQNKVGFRMFSSVLNKKV